MESLAGYHVLKRRLLSLSPTHKTKQTSSRKALKQDKVKYAVSEREDRFDNVNKDDWLYWDVLGCN